MQKVLLIGASEFGRDLAAVLVTKGFSVDMLDQEPTVAHEIELAKIVDHFFCTNALNIRTRKDVDITQYACCILCFRSESWMLLHIIESLTRAGAKDIRVRIDHRQQHDMEKLRAAGPVKLIDVEQLAGECVADSMCPQLGCTAQ